MVDAGTGPGLRRMIVQLRALPPADFDAVLQALDPPERSRTLALLAELDGEAPSGMAPVPDGAILLPDDLSPWLAARINGPVATAGEPGAGALTEATHRALRRVAATLTPQPDRTARPSLVQRVSGLLA